MLPRYYAMNYPNISKFKIFLSALIFIKKFYLPKTSIYLLKNFLILKIFQKAKLKSFNLYFFLDLISLCIIKNKLLNKNINFLIIGLNFLRTISIIIGIIKIMSFFLFLVS